MALRSDWSGHNCSIARDVDILGDPWTVLVLRELFFGNGRFDAIRARLQVADSVLTKRLASLVEAGLRRKGHTTTAGAAVRSTSSLPWARTSSRS
jgi:DNA-binding HxlR family transcriptional regulator